MPTRWIDFDNGNDNNDGLTRQTAWKTLHGGTNNPYDDTYFHGFQIGPGYVYKCRGTIPDIQYPNRPTFIDAIAHPAYKGTAANPIIFEAWSPDDRPYIGTRAGPGQLVSRFTRVIILAEGNTTFNSIVSENDQIHAIFKNFDFAGCILIEGDHVSVLDSNFYSDGDYLLVAESTNFLTIDRCYFEIIDYLSTAVNGNYIKFTNNVFQGININKVPPQRDSEDLSEVGPGAFLDLRLIENNEYSPEPDFLFANNTLIGFGSKNHAFTSLFFITDDSYPNRTRATSITIENNIFEIISNDSSSYSPWIWNIQNNYTGSVIIKNNLFNVSGFPYGLFYQNRSYRPATITFSPTTDVWADPLFVDAAAQNYRLSENSPAINKGDPSLNITYDKDNKLRDSIPDIGAYEKLSTIMGLFY